MGRRRAASSPIQQRARCQGGRLQSRPMAGSALPCTNHPPGPVVRMAVSKSTLTGLVGGGSTSRMLHSRLRRRAATSGPCPAGSQPGSGRITVSLAQFSERSWEQVCQHSRSVHNPAGLSTGAWHPAYARTPPCSGASTQSNRAVSRAPVAVLLLTWRLLTRHEVDDGGVGIHAGAYDARCQCGQLPLDVHLALGPPRIHFLVQLPAPGQQQHWERVGGSCSRRGWEDMGGSGELG